MYTRLLEAEREQGMSNVYEDALALHSKLHGKLETTVRTHIDNKEDLSLVYSPGVAQPCREIYKDVEYAYDYTWKGHVVAVVSDGSAVLGLGDIGPYAALPVMEGKCCLFKRFADIDAVPVVLDTEDPEEIIKVCKLIAPTYGGINLEDISAPRCIEIERRLKAELDIPVFHDDQHGTAIVVTAGLINALKLVGKEPGECTAVVSGAGAAGSSIIHMIDDLGIGKIYAFNSRGVLNKKYVESYTNELYKELAEFTNPDAEDISFEEAMTRADIFIGVSVPNKVTQDMVRSMKKDAIVFALANPEPEITYNAAREAGARVVGTGRSDFPNQVNNVLAFPGLFKGALKACATKITEEMKLAAAHAIARLVKEEELSEEYVIPSPFNDCVADEVAHAVETCAYELGCIHKHH